MTLPPPLQTLHSLGLVDRPNMSRLFGASYSSSRDFVFFPSPSHAKHWAPPVPWQRLHGSGSFFMPEVSVQLTVATTAPPTRTSCRQQHNTTYIIVHLYIGARGKPDVALHSKEGAYTGDGCARHTPEASQGPQLLILTIFLTRNCSACCAALLTSLAAAHARVYCMRGKRLPWTKRPGYCHCSLSCQLRTHGLQLVERLLELSFVADAHVAQMPLMQSASAFVDWGRAAGWQVRLQLFEA